jgi:catechol 2,3-dioxygenase-like lactoylglutathione lyase family enzyme
MGEVMAFDHIHLISRDPKAAADWYREMFGGEIAEVQPNLRGAPQIDVRVGGMTIVIRGQRPGEQPGDTKPMQHFDRYGVVEVDANGALKSFKEKQWRNYFTAQSSTKRVR